MGKFWYKGIIGIATGGSLSVSLANIAVYYALRMALEGNTPDELFSMKRFVDDLTGLWSGPHDLFCIWADSINAKLKEVGLSLKSDPLAPWDFSPAGVYSVFLDIKYLFDSEGRLHTDINIKKTDARVYLHFSSFHPRQTFPSIVYSQCLRYKRVINVGTLLTRRLTELKDCFLRSGYPKNMIDKIIMDVLKRPRNLEPVNRQPKPPAPVMWVHTYGAQSDVIKQLVSESNKIIKQSPAWKDEPKPMQMVCRRPRTLGDQLLQRKRLALTDSSTAPGTVRCTPLISPEEKRKRGRPCKSCSMMSHKASVTSKTTGKTYKTPAGNCKSFRLVYCAQCKLCQKQYVGRTVNKLQTRISGHRTFVNKANVNSTEETDEAALAEHLRKDHNIDSIDGFDNIYSFTILEVGPLELAISEQRWVSRLVTMRPFGLNIEKPNGVSDSVKTMSRKSLSTTGSGSGLFSLLT